MGLPRAEVIVDVAHNAFIAMDETGRITYWNRRAEEVFGHSAEAVAGSLVAETIIPERLREAHREGLRRFLETGEGPVLNRRIELTAARADGAEIPVEITISAVRNGGGWTFFAFVADISERHRAEQEREQLLQELETALRGSEQRLTAIVDGLAEAVTIRRRDERLTYANRAALRRLGLDSVEELRNSDPRELMGGWELTDDRGRAISIEELPSMRLLRGEDPEPLQVRSVDRTTRTESWLILKATAVRDGHGEIESAVTIIEDITEEKRAALRAEFIAQTSEELASSLDYQETLDRVAGLAVPQIADWCAVDLFDEFGRREPVALQHIDPEQIELARRAREMGPRELDPKQGIGRVQATGESVLYPEISDELLAATATSEEHLQLLRSIGFCAALIVPMNVGGRTIGALTLVSSDSGRTFGPEDEKLAMQIAERAAVAVENARLYTHRSEVARTLQQSLLPEALPIIPGWDAAAIYRPASSDAELEVGGDFYDVFPTEGGWLVLIGDVTGKGVQAAAMTSLVRHGARFLAGDLGDPSQILARLNTVLCQQLKLSLCTALCLRIEGDQISFSSAGHPLPLLITDDGVRALGVTGPMLGAFDDDDEWPTNSFSLDGDNAVLLYTDGVTDTVGENGRFGEQRLHRTMAECGPLPANELLNCLDVALSDFQAGPQADDTAALALRLAPAPTPNQVPARRRQVS